MLQREHLDQITLSCKYTMNSVKLGILKSVGKLDKSKGTTKFATLNKSKFLAAHFRMKPSDHRLITESMLQPILNAAESSGDSSLSKR